MENHKALVKSVTSGGGGGRVGAGRRVSEVESTRLLMGGGAKIRESNREKMRGRGRTEM